MNKVLKISFFLCACLIMTACPGGGYIKYKLVGGKQTSLYDYDAIVINQTDTVLLKVGIVETKIKEKKKILLVKFENTKGYDFNVVSSKYGKLSTDNTDKNIFKKEIRSFGNGDTVEVSHNSKTYYFTKE
jgi:hypothetical protein